MSVSVNPSRQFKPDFDMAADFHRVLGGENQTYQVFPEAKGTKGFPQIFHGTFEQHAEVLAKLNNKGYGIFATVNETDGKGRKAENIVRVRAVFVDLDGAPLEPVQQFELKPSMIITSSPGRYHAYWRCRDVPLDQFTKLQSEIAKRFNGDPAVKDLSRVMRLPGFYHMKAEPFLTRRIDHE